MKYYEVEIIEEVEEFLKELKESTTKKFRRAFHKVEQGLISKDYFKKLPGTAGLWEFRVQDNNSWYRVLAFMTREKGATITTIVAITGFNKKGDKTPKSEIDRATIIMKEFLDS